MLRDRRSAFSLVEVIIVIGIIGVIVGLTLPAVQQARGAATRASCLNNMRQIGLALHGYHAVHGHLPPMALKTPNDQDANSMLGWMALILPHIEHDALYQQCEAACRADPEVLHNPPHTCLATVVKAYVCADDDRLLTPLTDALKVTAAFSSYVGISGSMRPGATRGQLGVMSGRPGCRMSDITDGTHCTIMLGERPPPDTLQAGWWYSKYWWYGEGIRGPNNVLLLGSGHVFPEDDGCIATTNFSPGRLDNQCDRLHLWSLHRGGANFLFADASGRYFNYSADEQMPALTSRDGGETVSIPD